MLFQPVQCINEMTVTLGEWSVVSLLVGLLLKRRMNHAWQCQHALITHSQPLTPSSSLVPRLSWGRGKENLVTTAYTCANPNQQNKVS